MRIVRIMRIMRIHIFWKLNAKNGNFFCKFQKYTQNRRS